MSETLKQRLESRYPDHEFHTMEGCDDYAIGLVDRGGHFFVVYDKAKVLEHLVKSGVGPEDVEEYFEFNVAGSWLGDSTPGFVEALP